MTTFGSNFSPSIKWVQGMERLLSGLVASSLTELWRSENNFLDLACPFYHVGDPGIELHSPRSPADTTVLAHQHIFLESSPYFQLVV